MENEDLLLLTATYMMWWKERFKLQGNVEWPPYNITVRTSKMSNISGTLINGSMDSCAALFNTRNEIEIISIINLYLDNTAFSYIKKPYRLLNGSDLWTWNLLLFIKYYLLYTY